jgi:CheY-like chemotaxis protein
MAEQLLPDLIVLDLSIPVMNGLDAARVLKPRRPADHDVTPGSLRSLVLLLPPGRSSSLKPTCCG